ncbi:hypothetical protein [uncultured Kordia sp.]|uniref:hypothetical protein n=1 Tax=uncultured Kordia sp. TaxID=507699 RepID=UPI00261D1C62|nr:hypothetical protein [uncultured Kordia sp.]
MKKYLLLFFFVSFTLNAQTQDDAFSQQKKFQLNPWDNINGYRFALNSLKTVELEASYVLSSWPIKDPGYGGLIMRYQYLSTGIEYLRVDRKDVYGVKFAYENSWTLFSAQIGTDYLFSDKGSQVRLMPKVGLSLLGWVTLYYGWNINLLKNSALQPRKHNFILQVTVLNF